VVDGPTGAPLLDVDGETARVPASTTKLLTGTAALSVVGGGTRLATTVVQGSSPDEVVLVGAGDMLLGTGPSQPRAVTGRAGLGTLARQVAQALAGRPRRVVVTFDDTAFAGGTTAPTWSAADVSLGLTGRVAALGLARDRARPGHPGAADPALSAATAFAAALRQEGFEVAGAPARTTAPGRTRVLGRVESAPVADVLGVALRESDNALAEVLSHLVARALGRPPTFQDSAIAVLDQVQRLGVDTGSARLVDGSGLGRGSVVPARVLTDVLRLAARDDQPQLRPLLEGLPVSGFSGTLADRFRKRPAAAAAGLVRAKTGTLTGVNTFAGTTVDADGRLLVFAVMADRVPAGGTLAARAAMDRIGAALTACGCR
jgi:D-alanyl-D-alanine carboxypeptidase/D-alanyl-D-alanine-endopeptidase (penicillin-binding protein 4)